MKSIGVQPLAVCDNNPDLWGMRLGDVQVLSPAKAAERFGEDAVFFIAVRNEMHSFRVTRTQLTRLGCRHISSADPITWRFPEVFLPYLLYDLPHKAYEQAEQVLLAAELWQDEPSRAEYIAQVRLRTLGDPSGLSYPEARESYFLDGTFDLQPDDVFIDCGAFDGDTLRRVIAHQPRFGKVEAVEADSFSYARLAGFVETLVPELRSRIRLHNCAVGAESGKARFENSGKVDSKVCNSGETLVDLVPLDARFASQCVSMIKMDIEGGEFDALRGARKIIRRDRPILAICVYHSQQDLWRLPLLIRSMVSDYRMYLKAYRGDGIQTVVYAVPPERDMHG
ncbi:MAG TPA: FkbM family methyltransferase [Acidobacteriaceae bacterium]|nr:FkbM family methyltransferase [Acidobacteriaceae bacterium]